MNQICHATRAQPASTSKRRLFRTTSKLTGGLRRLLPLILLLASALGQAEAVGPLDAPLKLAELVGKEDSRIAEHRFIASRLTSIGNGLQAERQWLLEGLRSRRTWELPRLHDVDEIMEWYTKMVEAQGGQILFHCAGRDCGRSNDWANRVFDDRNLYGRDRDQRYLAAWLPASASVPERGQQVSGADTEQQGNRIAGQGAALAVYVIRRGNQRMYAHVELLRPDEAPDFGSTALDQNMLEFSSDLLEQPRALEQTLGEWLKPIQDAGSDWRLFIVSWHRSGNAPPSEDLGRARRQAETLQTWLRSRRIDAKQIQLVIIGPFGLESRYSEDSSGIQLVREPHAR